MPTETSPSCDHLCEAQRFPALDRDRSVAVHLGAVDLLQRLLDRADRDVAVGIGDEEPERAELLDHGDGEGRRILDALLSGRHEGGDRLILAAVVTGAVVGEADVARVQEGEDLKEDEEDDAGCEVLRRDALAREVDVVDQDGDRDHQTEDEPLLVGEQHERRVQRDRVDHREQQDLQQHPSDPL